MIPPKKPILGITMGDPGSIGPEIIAKALCEREIYEICRPIVIGTMGPIQKIVATCNLSVSVNECTTPNEALFNMGTIDILNLRNIPSDQIQNGAVTAQQGNASYEYVSRAIEMAIQGELDGTVTGPINKSSINLAGHHYAGHTEIFAEKTKTKDYTMMLTEGGFRVAHVSTHVSLREACDRVTAARVNRVIRLTHDALIHLGIETPRIAVAGLNPHCGEGCLFGDEDAKEIKPAVAATREGGIDVEGPIPADTVFCKMKGGMYDAVVVMYHDQGHIPTKLIGFQYDHKSRQFSQMAGVNVTLGLPIIRVSVDHGTAFDIAGRGIANPQSMIEAIRMATQLSKKGGRR